MSEAVRAVFFDVGGTLIRPWPSVGHVYAAVAAEHGITVTAQEMEASFRRAWQELKCTRPTLSTSRKEWWRELVFCALAGRATDAYFEALYARFARAAVWQVYADVRPALAFARQQGWHVGLISNWDERLRALLAELELLEWDSMTISCEVGVEKPASGIFEHALRTAGISAAAALHVGDSVAEDVAGARASGMQAALVERPATDLLTVLRGYAEDGRRLSSGPASS